MEWVETKIDRDLMDAVRERAAEEGRSEEELIEEAVRRYLGDGEPSAGKVGGTLGELLDRIDKGQKERGVKPLSEEEAMRLANEEVHALRREQGRSPRLG